MCAVGSIFSAITGKKAGVSVTPRPLTFDQVRSALHKELDNYHAQLLNEQIKHTFKSLATKTEDLTTRFNVSDDAPLLDASEASEFLKTVDDVLSSACAINGQSAQSILDQLHDVGIKDKVIALPDKLNYYREPGGTSIPRPFCQDGHDNHEEVINQVKQWQTDFTQPVLAAADAYATSISTWMQWISTVQAIYYKNRNVETYKNGAESDKKPLIDFYKNHHVQIFTGCGVRTAIQRNRAVYYTVSYGQYVKDNNGYHWKEGETHNRPSVQNLHYLLDEIIFSFSRPTITKCYGFTYQNSCGYPIALLNDILEFLSHTLKWGCNDREDWETRPLIGNTCGDPPFSVSEFELEGLCERVGINSRGQYNVLFDYSFLRHGLPASNGPLGDLGRYRTYPGMAYLEMMDPEPPRVVNSPKKCATTDLYWVSMPSSCFYEYDGTTQIARGAGVVKSE